MYIESQASAATVNSEFHFTDHDFAKIRTLIHRRAGIALGEQKRQMVYSRLSRRLRELRMPEFSRYLEMLESSHDGEEWQAFINSLTTNLTSFFREAHHFPVLAEHAKRSKQPVTIWCAAASTGEEPYSIAITLVEALGERAATARVIATDIDTAVLAKASAGVFTLEQVKAPAARAAAALLQQGHGRQRRQGARAARDRGHDQVRAAQPARPGVAGEGAGGRDLLPQRDDLLRQADAEAASSTASRRCSSPAACCSPAIRRTPRWSARTSRRSGRRCMKCAARRGHERRRCQNDRSA